MLAGTGPHELLCGALPLIGQVGMTPPHNKPHTRVATGAARQGDGAPTVPCLLALQTSLPVPSARHGRAGGGERVVCRIHRVLAPDQCIPRPRGYLTRVTMIRSGTGKFGSRARGCRGIA